MELDRSLGNTASLRPAHRLGLKHRRKKSKKNNLHLLTSTPAQAKESPTLWLCLYLPKLAVEAISQNHRQPTVVTESSKSKVLIYSVNEAASLQGIVPGHTLSSALALASDLIHCERDIKQEQQLLRRFAAHAYHCLSSMVSLDYENSILIEIGRSRQLWKQLDDIKQFVNAWLKTNHLTAELAWAPTPRAAYWLACAGLSAPVLCCSQIPAAIKGIPLQTIVDSNKFKHSGLITVADIQRMPRDGLVRRGGSQLLQELDQALGRASAAIHYWYPLPYFLEEQELILPSGSANILRPIVEALFASLACFLRQRQYVTRRLQLRFIHHHEQATVMTLGFTRNVSNVSEMLRIFDVQLSRCQFVEEVRAIELCCRQLHSPLAEHNDLFSQASSEESWQQLQDLFEARFGDNYFKPLSHGQDHRPEYAIENGHKDYFYKSENVLSRPVWLLAKAQSLTTIQGQPYWQGKLYLDESVERIEQGWWQGDDMRRDYYTARTELGAKVWVYRDLRLQQWFLHGFFG